MQNDVRERLIDAISKFEEREGRQPTRIHLSSREEAALAALDAGAIGGPLARAIIERGVRAAMPSFAGIEIAWDAPSLRLE